MASKSLDRVGFEMSASNFRPSLALVLTHEGGYVNHPADPGGATNKGITQKVYDAYRKYHGVKTQSVRHILQSEISDIYNKNYWRLVRGDSLPCGLDYAVFDFGVNSGVSRAIKYLQRLVGVAPDGVIGMVTLEAIDVAIRKNEEALIVQYCANRLAFVKSLKTFSVFGLGWTRRIVGYRAGVQDGDSGVVDFAVMMARQDAGLPLPTIVAPGRAVAPDEDKTYVEAPPVYTINDLRKLALANDKLATLIAAG